MKASELRIGNLIRWGHSVQKVESIYSDEVNGDVIQCNFLHSERSLSEYDPIPLTAEWIVKLGFYRKDKESSVYKIDISDDEQSIRSTLQWWMGMDHISVCRSGINAKSAHVEYVHQLQNLYFALTGEELTVKQ